MTEMTTEKLADDIMKTWGIYPYYRDELLGKIRKYEQVAAAKARAEEREAWTRWLAETRTD